MPEINNTTSSSDLAYTRANDVSYVRANKVVSTNANLKIEDFYKLMSAQMRYQDPSNPVSSSEMLNQMAQISLISTIDSMNKMSQTSYAANMIGKNVIANKVDPTTKKIIGTEKGLVTSINLSGKEMTAKINGKEYPMSAIIQIGDDTAKEDTTTLNSTVSNAEKTVEKAVVNKINNDKDAVSKLGDTDNDKKKDVPVVDPSVNEDRIIHPVG